MKKIAFIGLGLVCAIAHAGSLIIDPPAEVAPVRPAAQNAPAPVGVKPGAAVAEEPKKKFTALPADKNVRGVLNRWSREMKMQDVVWQIVGEDIPVDREISFTPEFEESLRGLMAATSLTSQPARACIHSNGVLRVISRTRFCDQP